MATDNRTQGAKAEEAVEAYCRRVLADAPAPSAERLDALASLLRPAVKRYRADLAKDAPRPTRRPRRRPTSAAAIVATTRR